MSIDTTSVAFNLRQSKETMIKEILKGNAKKRDYLKAINIINAQNKRIEERMMKLEDIIEQVEKDN